MGLEDCSTSGLYLNSTARMCTARCTHRQLNRPFSFRFAGELADSVLRPEQQQRQEAEDMSSDPRALISQGKRLLEEGLFRHKEQGGKLRLGLELSGP